MGHDLVLEARAQANRTPTGQFGGVRVTMSPLLGEDYWAYRVRLSDTQAIVGFPKHGTIGIGFAVEDDWNSNLPYAAGGPPGSPQRHPRSAEEIFEHIGHNKGDDSIPDESCIRAIEMVVAAAWAEREETA
jgi:hypothetical protein